MASASLIGPSKIAAFAISVVLCVSFPGLTGAESILTFDAPGAGTQAGQGTFPLQINAFGRAIGYFIDANNVYHGFERSPEGTITTIGAPGAGAVPGTGEGTVAESINREGTIAGQYQDTNLIYHSFLREPDGRFVLFEAPGSGTGPNQGNVALNINPEGEISGQTMDSRNVAHGFLRSRCGTFTLFDAPNAGTGSGEGTYAAVASGLNPRGVAIGSYDDANFKGHGYVREPGGAITEFDAPGSVGTFAHSINPEGVIVGGANDTNGIYHGFIRSPKGAITTFDVPGAGSTPGLPLGEQGTFPTGITPWDLITGFWADSKTIYHGFIRYPNGAITKFDAPGAGTVSGAPQGTIPQGINDWGEIVGYVQDSKNVLHGFIRFP